MSCGILDGEEATLVGPFPAKEAGPKIVDALFEHPSLAFEKRSGALSAYIMAHLRNMARGKNDAGQEYPFRVSK